LADCWRVTAYTAITGWLTSRPAFGVDDILHPLRPKHKTEQSERRMSMQPFIHAQSKQSENSENRLKPF
jgi:hypothetical protein